MDYFVTEIPRLCGCQALLNMSYYGFWRYTNFVLLLLYYYLSTSSSKPEYLSTSSSKPVYLSISSSKPVYLSISSSDPVDALYLFQHDAFLHLTPSRLPTPYPTPPSYTPPRHQATPHPIPPSYTSPVLLILSYPDLILTHPVFSHSSAIIKCDPKHFCHVLLYDFVTFFLSSIL